MRRCTVKCIFFLFVANESLDNPLEPPIFGPPEAHQDGRGTPMREQRSNEELWRAVLTGENRVWKSGWRWRRLIPSTQRCKNCNAPFDGIGAPLMRLLHRGRYTKNPRFCDF